MALYLRCFPVVQAMPKSDDSKTGILSKTTESLKAPVVETVSNLKAENRFIVGKS